jgi:hypothetical protein
MNSEYSTVWISFSQEDGILPAIVKLRLSTFAVTVPFSTTSSERMSKDLKNGNQDQRNVR